MIRVAFVCLGNICRSPMAELVFTSLVRRDGLSDKFIIDSFGTSDEEEGNGIYPPAAAMLRAHGISGAHTAKRLTARDAAEFDYILVMEERNRTGVLNITHGKYADRVHLLCDYTDVPRNVADPWYTRDFERAYDDIYDGCVGFLRYIKNAEGL